MKICKDCGYPIITAFCVAYKEMICFNCGNTYEMLNGCKRVEETPELLEKQKEMEEIKTKVYDLGFEREEDGRTSKSISVSELKERLEKVKNPSETKSGEMKGEKAK